MRTDGWLRLANGTSSEASLLGATAVGSGAKGGRATLFPEMLSNERIGGVQRRVVTMVKLLDVDGRLEAGDG